MPSFPLFYTASGRGHKLASKLVLRVNEMIPLSVCLSLLQLPSLGQCGNHICLSPPQEHRDSRAQNYSELFSLLVVALKGLESESESMK